MKKRIDYQKGQTLVLLLIYVVIALIITSAAVAIMVVNSLATDKVHQGASAFDVAESGIETAIIRLLRDPSYISETLTVGSGTATITITGGAVKTIMSEGNFRNFTRTIQATVDTSNNIITVTSWGEL